MTPSHDHTPLPLGGLLLGGQSRRMGEKKGLMPLPNGEKMGTRCLNTLKKGCSKVYLLGDVLDKSLDATLTIIPDIMPGLGPLAGVHAALTRNQEAPGWVFLPWDMPLLTIQQLTPLIHALHNGENAACYEDANAPGGIVPFPLALHPSVLPDLTAYLEGGQRSVWRFLTRLSPKTLPIKVENLLSLTSVNTPKEMDAMREILGSRLNNQTKDSSPSP